MIMKTGDLHLRTAASWLDAAVLLLLILTTTRSLLQLNSIIVTTKLHYIVCEQLLFSFSTSPSSCMHFAFLNSKTAILSLLQTRNV